MARAAEVESGGQPQRSRISLRVRLTLWAVLIFCLISTATQAISWLYMRSGMSRSLDGMLLDRAEVIALELGAELPDVQGTRAQALRGALDRYVQSERFQVDVLDGNGATILAHDRLEDGGPAEWAELTLPAIPEPGGIRFFVPRATRDPPPGTLPLERAVAVGVIGSDGREYAVVVASTSAVLRERMGSITTLTIVSTLVGAIAAGVSGWFIAGVAVAPFARLRDLAKQLEPRTISREIRVDSSISEVARLSLELEHARRRLERGFASQERFLSNVSHEIKTPIAVMLLEAETTDLSGAPEPVRRFVESQRDEMVRLGKLVESFLTLSRVRDGRGVARATPYAANDLVMDCLDNCAMMADQARVRLRPVLLSDESTLDTVLSGDQGLLRTMMDNLVRNAIRFSPAKGVVEVALHVLDGRVCIAVRDEGPGIPPDKVPVIFDRFVQAHEGTRRGRGHGLGLSIAQGIAELHGGSISAANRQTGGCEFLVSLPLRRVEPPGTDGDAELRDSSEPPGGEPAGPAPVDPE